MGFSFNANTLAIGGQLEKHGGRKLLPSKGSVTLPQEGGFGESVICDYCEEGISFLRAESRVYGSNFGNKLFKSFANVTVYGLDLEGRIQADVLSASITSINERVNGCGGESRISFDASIVGLVIDGHPYNVELDTKLYLDNGTFAEFIEAIARMTAAEVEEKARAFNWSIEECRTDGRSHIPQRCQNAARASIVSKIAPALTGDRPELRQQGFTIEVPNFGLLHLGEVMLTIGKRGINLLRVERGRTIEDLAPLTEIQDVSPESVTAEQRPTALALAEMPMLAAGGDTSGGYTVAHLTGNGTDFGPPP
ncbi:MAG: hypothetical protein M3P06_08915 [Acidobacteriota bacterium]|nr:hypothetical protein [Acidobacteriota bacterium]